MFGLVGDGAPPWSARFCHVLRGFTVHLRRVAEKQTHVVWRGAPCSRSLKNEKIFKWFNLRTASPYLKRFTKVFTLSDSEFTVHLGRVPPSLALSSICPFHIFFRFSVTWSMVPPAISHCNLAGGTMLQVTEQRKKM